MRDTETHYRTCNICEAMCGLAIQHREGEILSIKPDPDDPFSQGHICPKAVALQDFNRDPDRLKNPMRKVDGQWQEVSWEEAFAFVTDNIQRIQQSYGTDAMGVYLGNPNAHNFGNAIVLPQFFKALGSKNRYSSASADQLPHHVAANYMFGAGMVIPVPDVDRTDFMLIIGGNPVVSNGSMMTAPGMPNRIKALKKRGGKVVVIDPRRTETAKIASEHHFIQPGNDALFLLALLHVIVEEDRVQLGELADRVQGVEAVREAVQSFSPESVAQQIGISAADIRRLAQEFSTAPSAVCYSRMGASTQLFGGLCQWLTNVLNIVTGNFDREGGAMFPQPAFDLLANTPRGKQSSYGRLRSRVRGLPFYNGEFPVATLAEEIQTPGDGQIRGLITIAGNPVLSAPNGDLLDDAFARLDFMMCVDIYLNETTRHADIILPPTTGLEAAHFDVFFNSFAVRNTLKYSPPMYPKRDDQRHDWEILHTLASRLTGKENASFTPEWVLDTALKASLYGQEGLNLEKLLAHPHGIDLGPLTPCLDDRIRTADGAIQLAPSLYLADLERLKSHALAGEASHPEFPLALVSRRLARSHNTWTQNSKRLVKGRNPCTVQVHPTDADASGIQSGDWVSVVSRVGRVRVEVEVTDDMCPGVISIPQGWGHHRPETRMRVAAGQPGVSINSLTDHRLVDELTGNAVFNGVPVRLEYLEQG